MWGREDWRERDRERAWSWIKITPGNLWRGVGVGRECLRMEEKKN